MGEHRVPPAIELDSVSVRYRVPRERIQSLKDYVIQAARRRIAYDDFWAVRDVNLIVRPGEAFGIVGKNGSGKSTLLRTIARVMRPTTGRVVTRGAVAPLLALGAGFHMELTGRENVFLNGALLGFDHARMESLFDEIVDFAEVWDFIDAPVRAYSSGMGVRLAFAVATAVRPDILLVDEVLSVGDTAFQRKCRERMDGFRTEGTTVVIVTHNLEEVRQMCDRAAWIDGGHIQHIGDPSTVVRLYAEAARLDPSRTSTAIPDPAATVAINPAAVAVHSDAQHLATEAPRTWLGSDPPLYLMVMPTTVDQRTMQLFEGLVQPQEVCQAVAWHQLLPYSAEELARYKLFRGAFAYYLDEFLGVRPRYFTFLRDPVDRALAHIDHIRLNPSHFLHEPIARYRTLEQAICAANTLPLITNVQTRSLAMSLRPDRIARTLEPASLKKMRLELELETTMPAEFTDDELLERACNHLASFEYIGIVERPEESLGLLRHICGPRVDIPLLKDIAESHSSDHGVSTDVIDEVRKRTQLDQKLYEFAVQLFESRLATQAAIHCNESGHSSARDHDLHQQPLSEP